MSCEDENRKSKDKFWIIAMVLLTLVICSLIYVIVTMSLNLKKEAVGMSIDMKKEMLEIRQIQSEQFSKHIETNQFLLSTIDWSTRRTKMILFIRDQIVNEWRRIGEKIVLEEAYLIAETIVKECDNFLNINPFIVLATQNIESSFRKRAVSPMGARGINQIMPSTGRLLAAHFGVEYSDSLLFNIQTSTKFAVKLLDILYAQYNDWDYVLADYNGGPWQAYYYRKDKQLLAKETADYVPKILNKKTCYDSLFAKYKISDQIDKVNLANNKNQIDRLAYNK